ncbi:CidA/LrgA family protein [Psychrobacter sp. M13]|uniref:CidA/LrgA family protein n=1 Tax=Psychrobacter sp. M13 TaxID=3067275 RepID=UPI00273B983C|nr:CidA/LrgA family protein [Psychrobacter sp. M13]WLP94958.1 CidA/LrgA family protein [Psychrobacter sp. M13]
MPSSFKLPPWLAILVTLIMVVAVRESAVIICRSFGIEQASNVVAMVAMFLILVIWRMTKGLPKWLTRASNVLLVDSGFAFLPVSAGAGILLFGLGDELWGVMLTMAISTLIPLWGLAILANRWLNNAKKGSNKHG